jgi:hypothetical protein
MVMKMSNPILKVALVLPPTQSFFMPYSAPAALAAWLQREYDARTLVVDSGIDWLAYEIARLTPKDSEDMKTFAKLQVNETYRNIFSLKNVFDGAQKALQTICSSWLPERVDLSGKYYQSVDFKTWDAVESALDLSVSHIFDQYFKDKLIPDLYNFQPTAVLLSVPFDWMLFPTMRLASWLKLILPNVETVVGGHAINRLWSEKQLEFFTIIQVNWAAIGKEDALKDLVDYLFYQKKTGQ